MSEELLNPESISEEHDQEGKKAFQEKVAEIESASQTLEEKIAKIKGRQEQIPEEIQVTEQEIEIHTLALSDRLKTLIVRLKIRIGIEDGTSLDISNKKETTETAREALLEELGEIEQELDTLNKQLKELPQPQELLDTYHEKMREMPLSNQEKRELLTPEFLISLSTEEYIQLWRRLNPQYLSHVTRQGLRDHNAMIYHSTGMDEFHDGFKNVMNDEQEVKTPLAIEGLRERDEESIHKYLKDNGIFE